VGGAESKRYGVFSSREKGVKVRKLIVSEFVSLDGVMEAPGGEEGYRHTGWTIEFQASSSRPTIPPEPDNRV